MTKYGAEIRDIITAILNPIADVTVEDKGTASNVRAKLRNTGQSVDRTFVHGIGYSASARDWAKSILATYVSQPGGPAGR